MSPAARSPIGGWWSAPRARLPGAALCVACAVLFLLSCTGGPVSSEGIEPLARGASGAPVPETPRPGEDVNGTFPDEVYIKTRTQTFDSYHYYCLRDGRIYYKAIDRDGKPRDWTLFMKTGLPRSRRPGFRDAKRVAEISADADELNAISDEGRFYRIVFDRNYSRPARVWLDRQGWPASSPLLLDRNVAGNRGWSLGKRNSHVMYYEDAFGNQHHYGTMEIATQYVLLSDGQELRFSDTGLPSDFSRNFLGPERGRFVAEGLSASASTVFLIGAAGEMYTRLVDFDTVGSDPMFFKYTYTPKDYRVPGESYRSNYTPWGLPAEDWLKQPPVPLSGKAALTRRITILQNGRGNGARELRVAGTDAGGTTGYWFKSIFGASWSFRPAPLALAPSDFLPPNPEGAPGPRGPSLDTTMQGRLFEKGTPVPGWDFTLRDFNILEGSCLLTVRRGGESASFILHLVEAWTYVKRDSPGRDRTPKGFLATLQVPDTLDPGSLSPAFRAEIERSLLSADRRLFRYFAEATTDYFALFSRRMDESGFELWFSRTGIPASPNPRALRASASTDDEVYGKYRSAELEWPLDAPATAADLGELRARMDANARFRAYLSEGIDESRKLLASTTRSTRAYRVFELAVRMTQLYWVDFPKIHTLTRHGRVIMEGNRSLYSVPAETRIWQYGKLRDLADQRLAAYSRVAESLASGASSADFPSWFAETYRGYLLKIGLPEEAEGVLPGDDPEAGAGARLFLLPEAYHFPGYLLEAGDAAACSVLIEILDSAEEFRRCLERGPEPGRSRSYSGAVRFHILSAAEGGPALDRLLRLVSATDGDGRGGRLSWDGSTLRIDARAGPFRAEPLFAGGAPRDRRSGR